ncbi:MAG: peptidoglycan-binding domain-containing protein [Candidatus Caenarcaniphilales bacterium]|nr:peptidoglycan-binding domain-containing protein [Candidatus Caenarcaniphilales bacterium]
MSVSNSSNTSAQLVASVRQSNVRQRPTLRRGSRGPYVRTLQTLLNKFFGFQKLTIDGHFGPKTLSTVRRFQRLRKGLTVDGIVGPQTWKALALAQPSLDPKTPPSGERNRSFLEENDHFNKIFRR